MSTNYGHGVYTTDETPATSRIKIGESGQIGIIGTAPDADKTLWPDGEPIAIRGDISVIEDLGDTGSLPNALRAIWAEQDNVSPQIAVIRVDEGDDVGSTQAKIIGDAASYSGVYQFPIVKDKLGFEPDILLAPGYDAATSDKVNPVLAALTSVASRMRSVVFGTGPNSTTTEALAAAALYGSDRLELIDPYVRVQVGASEAEIAGSVIAAAIQARMDLTKGFWHSYSNKLSRATLGLSRPIAWRVGDKGCEAVQLNKGRMGTFINQNGFRPYSGGTTDTNNQFGGTLVGRRVADKVYDALEIGLHALVDTPIDKGHFSVTRSLVTKFLSDLKVRGAIVGWEFDFHPELNSTEKLASGEVYWKLRFVEAAQARDITIFGARKDGLYHEYLSQSLMENAA